MGRMSKKLYQRYDYNSGEASKVEMTPEGFMKVSARATRIGVLKYKQMDGTIIRELRHPEEVFNPKSYTTLAMKPVTNNHPVGLLDSETASDHTVGMTGENVTIGDEKFLDVNVVITDKKTISDAEGGKVEVSPGYTCELDFTPGVFDGEEYDAIQRNIRYNHLATVKKGRSGPEVRLRLDSEDGVQVELENKTKGANKMRTIKIDGEEFKVADEVAEAMDEKNLKDKKDAKAKAKEMEEKEEEMKDAKDKLSKSEKDKEKLEAKADALESELKKLKETRKDASPEEIRAAVKARSGIEKVAEKIGVEKFDAMEDMDLKKAVILADSPDTKLDGKSDEYINARFDMAAEIILKSETAAKDLGKKLNDGAGKGTEVMDADEARQKMIERNQNAWKGEKAGK